MNTTPMPLRENFRNYSVYNNNSELPIYPEGEVCIACTTVHPFLST